MGLKSRSVFSPPKANYHPELQAPSVEAAAGSVGWHVCQLRRWHFVRLQLGAVFSLVFQAVPVAQMGEVRRMLQRRSGSQCGPVLQSFPPPLVQHLPPKKIK